MLTDDDEKVFPGIMPLHYASVARAADERMSYVEKEVRRAVEAAQRAFAFASAVTVPIDPRAERRGFEAGFRCFEQTFMDANTPPGARPLMQAAQVAGQVCANRAVREKELGATLNAAYLFAEAFRQGRVGDYNLHEATRTGMAGYVLVRAGMLASAFRTRGGDVPSFKAFIEGSEAEQQRCSFRPAAHESVRTGALMPVLARG